jgi:AcrR family transcriptional regulator
VKPPNRELERTILDRTLALVIERGPERVGMRDIARACGVTATTIYYYFRDKEALLEAVKLDCLAALDTAVSARLKADMDPLRSIRAGLTAFRDWAFANPHVAHLVMSGFTPSPALAPEELEPHYRSTRRAIQLLERAVASGMARSGDPTLDGSVAIAMVWGAVESVLRMRTLPEYWEAGEHFTNRAIDACITLFTTEVSITGGRK